MRERMRRARAITRDAVRFLPGAPHRKMINMALRSLKMVVLLGIVMGAAVAHAKKPPKTPVAFGKWTGPHAGTFKSALRNGISKGCVVVRAEKARVIIDGEVGAEDKPIKVRVILKSPKTSDVVESREYTFSKPSVSQAQSSKMGREVAEMARRAPDPANAGPL
jgi:hypothetical protein